MSGSKSIEAEIQQLEANIALVFSQLDVKIQEFSIELPPAVEAWMNDEVKRKIVSNAETVNKNGTDSMRDLKAELAILIAQIPQICVSAISQQEKWPHRVAAGETPFKRSNAGESYFTEVFRTAISPLGSLLSKYDLLKEKSGYAASWKRVSVGIFQYAFNPGFEERNFSVISEYKELHKWQRSHAAKLKSRYLELEKAKAQELWDNA